MVRTGFGKSDIEAVSVMSGAAVGKPALNGSYRDETRNSAPRRRYLKHVQGKLQPLVPGE
jgi:hypothetical protein